MTFFNLEKIAIAISTVTANDTVEKESQRHVHTSSQKSV